MADSSQLFHIYKIDGGLIYSDSRHIWNDIADAMAETFGCRPADIGAFWKDEGGRRNRYITVRAVPVAYYG